MRRAADPRPRPAPRPAPPRRPVPFRRILVGVLIAHLLILLGIALFRLPAKQEAAGKPGQPIAMFTPLPAAPAPAKVQAAAPPPAPTPTPEPPAPTPPEPTPEPAPAPEAPSQIVLPPKPEKPSKPAPDKPKAETPKPAPAATPAKPAPAPSKPEKHVPKVNLTEVSHGGAPAPAKPPAHTAAGATGDGEGAALKPSDISGQLSTALKGSGATKSVPVVGPPGEGGNNGNSEYYQLIQRAMYGAWDQPADLAGRHLVSRIEIHIARDGTITGCSLAATSGNPSFDQSALAAARRVGRLSKPRPDDVPESVAINFQLAD